MTDYNDGKWHGWNGGECPVHPKSEVQVALDTGMAAIRPYAFDYGWDHNLYREGKIVAFRVTKPYVEPPKTREIWVNVYDDGSIGCCYETEANALASGYNYASHRTVKFIEVIEE